MKWITAEINALKQEYALVISAQQNSDNKVLLEEFIANCLRLYEVSLSLNENVPASDRLAGDEVAILAAMGCIRCFEGDDYHRAALFKCALILERLLAHSKHNEDALILIIRVYIHLGATRKAVEHYTKLDIKHIQNLTDAWILLTRISTIHPHAFPRNAQLPSPAQLLTKALCWTVSSDSQAISSIINSVKYDSFMSLLSLVEYARITETCLARCSFICEARRINRFRHSNLDDISHFRLGMYSNEP